MNTGVGVERPMKRASRERKGQSLLALPDRYTVIDVETTGLDPSWNDIIEFGAARVENGGIVSRFSALVNSGYQIGAFITELTGITNQMLSSAPAICAVLPEFLDFVGDGIVIGHNVNFDVNFIYDHCVAVFGRPFPNDFIDTMRLSRRLFPQERHHRLCNLIDRFGIGDAVGHRALADAEQTHRCYLYMKQYMADRGIDVRSLIPAKPASVKKYTY